MTHPVPLLYAGPISFYRTLIDLEKPTFDVHENFIKQTFRNRCRILTAQGIADLIIPIAKPHAKVPMRSIEISYAEPWPKHHLRALQTAYGASPFFEYYDYLLAPIFDSQPKHLIDFNLAIHAFILKAINFNDNSFLSKGFEPYTANDFRLIFSPKTESPELPQYQQVFGYNNPFVNDLSVFDLIFNLGPESLAYLKA